MVLVAGIGLYRLVQSGAARNHIQMLRDSTQYLRAASDSCNSTLESSQTALVMYRGRLDSLYRDVRDFEEADLGGVPAAEYTEYMEQFTAYRDSADAWDGRVASLESTLAECRTLAELHNVTVDSLRAAVERQR